MSNPVRILLLTVIAVAFGAVAHSILTDPYYTSYRDISWALVLIGAASLGQTAVAIATAVAEPAAPPAEAVPSEA